MKNFFWKYRYFSIVTIVFVAMFFNSMLLATSTLMEYERNSIAVSTWEPFVWELSSHLVIMLLIFGVIWCVNHFPLKYGCFWRHFFIHMLASLIFSIVHIAGMVLLRKLIYYQLNSHYDFGSTVEGFVYEYRKDLMTYVIIVTVIHSYQFWVKTMRGEASLLAESESQPETKCSDKLLVKKKGVSFILDSHDILSVEAGGNYVYLQLEGQTYPLRATMKSMQSRLYPLGFIRVHRSYLINTRFIESIQKNDDGDSIVILSNGKKVPISRQYKGPLKKIFMQP